jgi:DNA primase small subunit
MTDKMPHSVSAEEVSQDHETSTPIETNSYETTMTEASTETEEQEGDNEPLDQDMTMENITGEDTKNPEVRVKAEEPAQVKLDDLFDFDSDEEFPSSTGQDVKPSSPEAPLSPVWVLYFL